MGRAPSRLHAGVCATSMGRPARPLILHSGIQVRCQAGARACQRRVVFAPGRGSPSASQGAMSRWLFQAPLSASTLTPSSLLMCPDTCAETAAIHHLSLP
jgi:murein endopeptidase